MAGFWRRLAEKINPAASAPVAALGDFFARFTGEKIDWEETFIEADLGYALADQWQRGLEKEGIARDLPAAREWLALRMRELVVPPPSFPAVAHKPETILLVGVNGGGKTTTAAKLAHRALGEGRTVLFGAADTFRAAAVDQLQVWGERLGVPVISAPPGTDPASVAYRAHESAILHGSDLLIVDTAGRLPNKSNLMLEIGKVKRILQKRDAAAPHHAWLVADGTSGNSVLTQAREFHEAVGLTGMILTKYDSSAKGGMIAAVRAELGIPTLFIGKGESPDDLVPFDPEAYVRDFFGE
ncbi:fused signal recognition particle receptor [Verrucomicrobium sp. GAS474]|uniref:signal recognition particle-docking protein FtsY n=1 Tax=Verrucomicrobium sp. GAS474 TaxID=1882831 RepID=UPI00087B4AB6|nr:signal recognition particle-docking protein FtsY [Verrucomicrobium sp. GAS474]SDU16359.1 fused signal recognition particle receptor [Verrucomicrobium sp. GAS474]